jgi:hypothetical protein
MNSSFIISYMLGTILGAEDNRKQNPYSHGSNILVGEDRQQIYEQTLSYVW